MNTAPLRHRPPTPRPTIHGRQGAVLRDGMRRWPSRTRDSAKPPRDLGGYRSNRPQKAPLGANHAPTLLLGILHPLVIAGLFLLVTLPSASPAAEPKAADFRLLHIGTDATGNVTAALEAPQPGVYEVQVSDDFVTWHSLFKQSVVHGRMEFLDPTARHFSQRYYRAVLLEEPAYIPGEILLQYRTATTLQARNQLEARAQLTIQKTLLTTAMWRSGAEPIVQAYTPLSVFEALAILQADPSVEFAEPNYVLTKAEDSPTPSYAGDGEDEDIPYDPSNGSVTHDPYSAPEGEDELPINEDDRFGNEGEDEPLLDPTAGATIFNDPLFTDGSLWGMQSRTSLPANEFGSQAAALWEQGFTGSERVYVGVLDEGIQITHPDLAHNIWSNPFEIPRNGLDDDGNGYIDDIHGWDFFHNDNSVFDGSPDAPDLDAHGTHVAGTIGAVGGNAIGVAGMNWDVTLIPAKFLGPRSGTIAGAIEAIDYFVDLKERHGLNIVALNNSWGGGGYSTALHLAIHRAARAGILFVAAAGNGGTDVIGDDNDSAAFFPSGYDTTQQALTSLAAATFDAVISVAAIDRQGGLAGFSNYGANEVDLGAPGVGIWSTMPWLTYGPRSGTSMAAPHVTGAAALYASIHPGASAADIRQALLQAAEPTPSLQGKCSTGGRLNLVHLPWAPTETIYVDRAYTGQDADGSRERPFPTVNQGHAAARSRSLVLVHSDVYLESLRLTKAIRLEPHGGTVRIVPWPVVQ